MSGDHWLAARAGKAGGAGGGWDGWGEAAGWNGSSSDGVCQILSSFLQPSCSFSEILPNKKLLAQV